MKKIIRKRLLILVVAISVLGFVTNVTAATSISIGTNYGDGADSSGEASTAYNKTKSMGYTAYLSTAPTISTITSYAKKFSNSGSGGALFFHGHASSERIIWNYLWTGGNYAVGITRQGSMCSMDGYDLLATSKFGLSNAKLAVFMGCNTATASTNIANDAKNKGAKATIGWAATIYEGDTDKWVSRFYTKLASGGSISASVNYANSFSDYSHSSAIKATRTYGAISSTMSSSDLETMNISEEKVSNLEKINSKTYRLIARSTLTEANVANYIKQGFNSNFNENNYTLEHTTNGDQEIYDFNLLINGLKSNIGYTILINEDKVTVIDNMKNYNENIVAIYSAESANEFNEENAIEIALEKNPSVHENVEITFYSTLKRIDVETGKMYFDVNLRAYDTLLEVESIITETFEM